MAKWSMGLALIGMCLTGTAEAQWGGAAPCREMVPGPLDICMAPEGPSNDLGIPADLPNAFSDRDCNKHPDLYFYSGSQALMRHHMGRSAVGTAGGVVVQQFDQMPMNVEYGPSGGLGLRCDCGLFDVGGYYLFPHDSSITDFGAVVPVIPNVTAGGPFLRTTLTSSLGNYEANYICSSNVWQGPEWLFGVRFMDLQEKLRIQDGNVYTVRAFNRIVGPSFGVQCPVWNCGCCALLAYGKGTWGWNIIHTDGETRDLAGAVTGAQQRDTRDIISQIYEVGLTLNLQVCDELRVRFGWQALWALRVAEAVKQIGPATGVFLTQDNQGSILYHGPMFQMEWVF